MGNMESMHWRRVNLYFVFRQGHIFSILSHIGMSDNDEILIVIYCYTCMIQAYVNSVCIIQFLNAV